MLKKSGIIKQIVILLFMGATSAFSQTLTHPGTFSHLGALESNEELVFVKAKIAAHEEPWYSSYNDMLGWAVAGNLANVGTGENGPRDLCKNAYANALAWHYTGNVTYANNAIAILNAWGKNFTGYNPTPASQSLLVAGWIGTLLGPAAELMRDYVGWTAADKAQMKTMFQNAFYPAINLMSTWNGNVDLTQIQAMLAISTFNEDVTEFNAGLLRLEKRNPAYFYLASDDPSVRNYGGSTTASWSSYTAVALWVDGLTQETCRDMGHHAQFAMAASIAAAEIAWHQGVDVYAAHTERYVATLELMAKQLRTGNMQGTCAGNPAATADRYNTFEIGYNHFHNRMGIDLPETALLIEQFRNPLAEDSWNIFYETLTHAGTGSEVLLCSKPNLGADQSICGKANIALKSNVVTANKTFKWYKDDVLLPTATTANYTATTSGVYRVEVDSLGCVTKDNVAISGSLSVNLGKDIELCNPAVATLDAGLDGTSYLWSTGATSQTITVTRPNTYSVTVSAANCTSVSDAVIVTSKLLTVVADTICQSGVIDLTVLDGSSYNWYDVATNGVALLEGSDTYSPTITTTKTFYVEDAGGMTASIGKKVVGAGTIWGANTNADFSDAGKINQIIVAKALTISSLAVYVSAGNSVTINLRQNGIAVHTKTVTVTGTGKQVVNLGFNVSPGTYVLDAVGTTATIGFEATGGAPQFPYVFPDYLTYTYNVAWSAANGWYGYFYDITFVAGNVCARTPVVAVVDPANSKCSGNNYTTQNIDLSVGWNLISFNVEPANSSIVNVFAGVDFSVIKTTEAFYYASSPVYLNSLQDIETGQAYLIKVNVAKRLAVTGTAVNTPINPSTLKTGWNLVGVSQQTISPISNVFNATNCLIIKDFDGFWEPNGVFNSIDNLEPGKGYFVKMQ